MFKNKKKIKIVVLVACSFALILCSVFFIKDERNLTIAEKLIKDGSLFLGNLISIPINYVKTNFNEIKEKNDLYKKYKDLEEQIDSYESVVAEKEELLKEIEELKSVVQVNSLLSERLAMNAVVINRNINYWHDTVTIDKGSKNGVYENMPVVTNKGLIGKVVSVSHYNSVVRLLTSSSATKISVKIPVGDGYVYGLISGYDKKNNTYQIEGISQNVKLEMNALVTTTGMGDIFPSGLLIGKVVGTKSDSYDLSVLVEVSPSVDFNSFNIVTILKRNIDK